MAESRFVLVPLLSFILILSLPFMAEPAIGVNWGTLSFHRLSPTTVVDLFKQNKIQKVKLFEADPDALKALMGSGIQVMVGIPNEMLFLLSSSTQASDLWVRQNVSAYTVKGGVDIRYLFSYASSLLGFFFFFYFLFSFCPSKFSVFLLISASFIFQLPPFGSREKVVKENKNKIICLFSFPTLSPQPNGWSLFFPVFYLFYCVCI